MARRKDLPEIQLVSPGGQAANGPAGPGALGGLGGAGGPADPEPKQRDDEGTDWWRWALALAAVVAVVIAVIVFDRRGPQPAEALPPTTVAAKPVAPTMPGTVTEAQLPVPSGLAGTLYAVTDDDRLAEVDLATGRSRLAELSFEVQPWLVTQVVALEEVVLISTRRQVYAVDRATLSEHSRVADGRWVVAAPDGSWAALVPFGAATGEITFLDASGMPAVGEPLRLPSGVTVQGALDDGLVVDVVGSLQLLYPDGQSGPVIGTGKYLASGGAGAVARVVCSGLNCQVRAGTVAQPDAVVLDEVSLAGSWYFGAGAVFDPQGERLALLSSIEGAEPIVQALDLTAPAPRRWQDSPIAPRAPGALPALAFTADGSTLVHTSANGLVLWHVERGSDASSGPNPTTTATTATAPTSPTTPATPGALVADELRLSGGVLAVTVTPQPPPPPPQSAGPPPSYA